ncbi:DUF3558 domain-containing protein [Actinokineospora sp.]|uniref:DUF3558 domain-containing protein n=1 Tax=Actinokineospora sp. TaxID=1872133 RepID=UPI0040377901
MRKAHSIALLVTATMLLVGVTSCSETAGQAIPQPESTTATRSTESAPPGTTPSSPNELDKLDPCALLTAAEVAQFGAEVGERDDTTQSTGCQWTIRGQAVFSIALRAKQGLDDIVVDRGTVVDHRVGTRDGRKLEANDGPGACMISISITRSSRVDASSNARSDTAKACGFASKVAELIEPRLPKGE